MLSPVFREGEIACEPQRLAPQAAGTQYRLGRPDGGGEPPRQLAARFAAEHDNLVQTEIEDRDAIYAAIKAFLKTDQQSCLPAIHSSLLTKERRSHATASHTIQSHRMVMVDQFRRSSRLQRRALHASFH
ncbi:MAG: hypothetical protein AAF805_08555 [Planctomycetota bacterium]